MNYEYLFTNTPFLIPVEAQAYALQALRSYTDKGNSVATALFELGWGCESDDEGNIQRITLFGAKYDLIDKILATLAPYTAPGSYMIGIDEQQQIWRLMVTPEGKIERQPGRFSFGEEMDVPLSFSANTF